MFAHFIRIVTLACLPFVFHSAFAADVLEYTQKTLSNGSSVMDYTTQDGKRLRQVQHPDGTITTTEVDNIGKQTITKQRTDGSIEVKTIEAPPPQTAENTEPVQTQQQPERPQTPPL